MNSQKPIVTKKQNNPNNSKQKRRAKSIILYFLFFIIGTTVLCLAILGALSETDDDTPQKGTSYLFYEPDYDLNILANEEYLDLDRTVRFENPDNGITYAIEDRKMDEVPTFLHNSVNLLCDFVDYAILGESEKLNKLFSDEYIEAGGKIKMDFTMQQLYNIKITYVTSVSDNTSGYISESHDFWLEYMIHKNNGTFRNDMESDCIRKEYVRVTDRDGKLGIDVLSPYNTVEKEPSSSKDSRIFIAFAASAVLVGLTCFVCARVARKKK